MQISYFPDDSRTNSTTVRMISVVIDVFAFFWLTKDPHDKNVGFKIKREFRKTGIQKKFKMRGFR